MIFGFWVPSIVALALTILGIAAPNLGLPMNTPIACVLCLVVAALLVWAWYLAKHSQPAAARGGSGGTAEARGQDSDAEGGAGGKGTNGTGGDGGNAIATGKGAKAKGGRGGSA